MFTDYFKRRAALTRVLGAQLEQIAQLTRERDDARAQRNRLNEANAAFSAQIEQQAATLARVTHERDDWQQKYDTVTRDNREKPELAAEARQWKEKYDAAQAELARLKGQDGAQKPASKRKGKEG